METIKIKSANENNLKNIDLEIPRNKLIVFTAFGQRQNVAGVRYHFCGGATPLRRVSFFLRASVLGTDAKA